MGFDELDLDVQTMEGIHTEVNTLADFKNCSSGLLNLQMDKKLLRIQGNKLWSQMVYTQDWMFINL